MNNTDRVMSQSGSPEFCHSTTFLAKISLINGAIMSRTLITTVKTMAIYTGYSLKFTLILCNYFLFISVFLDV